MQEDLTKQQTAQPDPKVLQQVEGGDEPGTDLVVRPSFGMALGGQFKDTMRPPVLQITHGVGGLAEAGFQPGDLVLGKEHLIYSPARPKQNKGETPRPKFIILDFRQYWKEYTEAKSYVPGVLPKTFATEKEAHDAGFTTQRTPDGRLPTAPPAMTWAMLIEKPADLICPLFCLEIDGKQYAPATFPLDKGAYLSVKETFIATLLNAKARGIYSVRWELFSATRTAMTTGKVSNVPKVKVIGYLSDAEIAAIKPYLPGAQAANA